MHYNVINKINSLFVFVIYSQIEFIKNVEINEVTVWHRCSYADQSRALDFTFSDGYTRKVGAITHAVFCDET